eukprot:COSAG05_NODE_130_length_17165_cov_154.623638_8_plen_171_part_00
MMPLRAMDSFVLRRFVFFLSFSLVFVLALFLSLAGSLTPPWFCLSSLHVSACLFFSLLPLSLFLSLSVCVCVCVCLALSASSPHFCKQRWLCAHSFSPHPVTALRYEATQFGLAKLDPSALDEVGLGIMDDVPAQASRPPMFALEQLQYRLTTDPASATAPSPLPLCNAI